MRSTHLIHLRSASAAIVVWLICGAAAHAEVYKCQGENGTIEYRNVGDTKGCKRIDNAPITVVPASKPASASSTARPSAAPTSAAQRQRDDDRRTILEGELKSQEDRLAELRKEYNNGEPERRGDERNYQKYLDRTAQLKDEVARTEANVASLKRELGTISPSR